MAKTLFPIPKPSSLSPQILIPSSKPLINTQRFKLYPKPTSQNSINSFKVHGTPKPGSAECPVPLEQQPIHEYQNLSKSFPFSWATGEIVEYSSRLAATGLCVGLLVGLPVSWFGSVGSDHDPVKLAFGSISSGLLAVTLAVLRMYLGWAYVGNRLLSATVEYEETGWYDGQVWVKTPEVLARDRLLGSFQSLQYTHITHGIDTIPIGLVLISSLVFWVKPVLSRLKNSLVELGISLFVCVAIFINYEASQKEVRYTSNEGRDRVVAGIYNDDSARSFEPEAFCGEPGLVTE